MAQSVTINAYIERSCAKYIPISYARSIAQLVSARTSYTYSYTCNYTHLQLRYLFVPRRPLVVFPVHATEVPSALLFNQRTAGVVPVPALGTRAILHRLMRPATVTLPRLVRVRRMALGIALDAGRWGRRHQCGCWTCFRSLNKL